MECAYQVFYKTRRKGRKGQHCERESNKTDLFANRVTIFFHELLSTANLSRPALQAPTAAMAQPSCCLLCVWCREVEEIQPFKRSAAGSCSALWCTQKTPACACDVAANVPVCAIIILRDWTHDTHHFVKLCTRY